MWNRAHHFGLAALAAISLLSPATATADPSLGPFLARDLSISSHGHSPAAVGFSPMFSGVGALGYLVVWAEATNASSGSDIYGRAMTATGAYYGAPFVIASHPGHQDSPVVAFDGYRFLVVWHDQPSDALVARAVYLDGPGRGNEIAVATRGRKPAIAADPHQDRFSGGVGRFLVVWESSNVTAGSQGDISGQFFDVHFDNIVAPGVAIPGYYSPAHESAPSVAFGGDRFLVTWNTEPVVNDDAHRDIQGVVMTADGYTVWGEFPITTAPSWQQNSGGNSAFNGTDFLVVWGDHRAGGDFEDVYAARVTPTGALLDGPPDTGGIPVSLDAGEGLPHGPQVVALEDSWLVVWAGTRARAARVAFDGVVGDPVGAVLSASAGTQFFPVVASDGRNAFVTWGEDATGIYAQVVGRRPGSMQDLIAEVDGLVADSRLSPSDGSALVQRLTSGALDLFLSRVEHFLFGYACATGSWNPATGCRIAFADTVMLSLQGRWLLPTPLVSTVDLGNEFDEWQHQLEGWGGVNPGLLPPELDPDRTSRYQLLRGSNSVTLTVPQPGTPHVLGFRTEDGGCDDSFDVYVNGVGPIYSYRAETRPDTFFPLHKVPVPGSQLIEPTARITFVNRATDSCGLAATYFVSLVPMPKKVVPPHEDRVSNVDLGNPADEALHNLEGWDGLPDAWLPPEIDTDRTARFQLLRSPNSLTLAVPRPGVRHALSFRTGDGFCDDSFDVYVNGRGPVYSYRADARPVYLLAAARRDGGRLAADRGDRTDHVPQHGTGRMRAGRHLLREAHLPGGGQVKAVGCGVGIPAAPWSS